MPSLVQNNMSEEFVDRVCDEIIRNLDALPEHQSYGSFHMDYGQENNKPYRTIVTPIQQYDENGFIEVIRWVERDITHWWNSRVV